jgi:single-stranded DNA-binding protein
MSVPRRDKNRVELVGVIASPAVTRCFESGATLLTFSVRVRYETEDSQATDNVPVAWWAPSLDQDELLAGHRVRVSGRVCRRFYQGRSGLRSAVEVIASEVEM